MAYKVKSDIFMGEDVLRIENDESFAVIDLKWGANILAFVYKGTSIINSDKNEVAAKGFTGCPVLYPTPNRVKNCKTKYGGKEYTQTRDGKPHLLHGYAFYNEFQIENTDISDSYASVTLSLEIHKEPEILKNYPFKNKLLLKYTLTENSFRVDYSVENLSDSDMPFGFGLHPYFYYNEDAFFSVPSDKYVETDKDVIPTRRFLNTSEKFGEINKGIYASTASLDNNLIRRENENAVLYLTGEKVKITFNASESFRHFVVYHPKNSNFICIENQTCSIDANNLYNEGFKELSGQIILSPHKTDKGFVEYIVEKTN